MDNVIKYNNGSEWIKWDLHIHSPLSFLNNKYENDWTNWVDKLVKNEIKAIGLTNYFRFNSEKDLSEIDIVRDKLKNTDIKVFPNLEFRIGQPNKDGDFINIHIIFSDKIETSRFNNFFTRLKLENEKFCSDLKSTADFEKAVINKKDLEKALKDNFNRIDEYLIVCVPNGYGGFRSDNKVGRSVEIANLYDKMSDFVFAREQDRDYFLKEIRYENSIPKACIFCSDAHSIADIGSKFTWIKANPTYEGLKQIIFEPVQRVRIQQEKPEQKSNYQIIKKIRFVSGDTNYNVFGNQEIYLNPNLNSIIGGKSSGKSLLLHTIAQSIDPEQVKRTEKKLEFKGYNLSCNFEVDWADGTVDKLSEHEEFKNKKITYIPQLYINYLVEQNSKDELNKLVLNILRQDSSFKTFYDDKIQIISEITNSLNEKIDSLLFALDKGISINNEIKSKGGNLNKSESITKFIDEEIAKLETNYKLIQEKTKFDETELKEYQDLISQKNSSQQLIQQLAKDKSLIEKIYSEALKIRNTYFQDNIGYLEEFAINSSARAKEYKDFFKNEFELLIAKLSENKLTYNIDNQTKEKEIISIDLEKKLEKYVLKLKEQKELETVLKNIEKEKEKKRRIIELNDEKKSYENQYKEIRKQIKEALENRLNCFYEIKNLINKDKRNIGIEIELETNVIIKREKFPFYEQCNKKSISDYFGKIFPNEFVNLDELSTFFEKIQRIDDNKLLLHNENWIYLKDGINLKGIYSGIAKDSFELDFRITYQNDELLKMSPGKKGTVLLILFLKISTDDYPILIDQPEDNLDNRTIYNLLTKFIKEKKLDRQIIIVSHNANLVVATDSENVIVANQDGQEIGSNNNEFRFEYANGSLENSYKIANIKAVLKKQGIKEQVCDILEGGEIAFKKREEKYGIR